MPMGVHSRLGADVVLVLVRGIDSDRSSVAKDLHSQMREPKVNFINVQRGFNNSFASLNAIKVEIN